MTTNPSIGGITVLSAVLGILLFATEAGAQPARADFNGDGYDDLAIGVPFEDIGTFKDVGAIHVLYGSPGAGVTATRSQFFNRVTLGGAVDDLRFGAALASGDFDGDGFSDLAVGAPGGSPVSSGGAIGEVDILYGSPFGITISNAERVSKLSFATGLCHRFRNWGATLAAADFDADGRADLAVGHAGSRLVFPGCPQLSGLEAVHVLYGSPNGLADGRRQDVEHRFVAPAGMTSLCTFGECHFGYSLAAGDFDGNGFIDLAVGAPGTNLGGPTFDRDEGAVHVVFSTAAGLIPFFNQFLTQDSPGIMGVAQTSDYFGGTLHAGDFNGDARADLVVGSIAWHPHLGALFVVQEYRGEKALNVLFGSLTGLTSEGNLLIENAGVGLAVGDFDGDGFADLANEGTNGLEERVRVFHGSVGGLCGSCARLYSQNTAGIVDTLETGDAFGRASSAGDFNGDGVEDLAIGAPGEDVLVADTGAVAVLYGAYASGLTSAGNTLWHQNMPGIDDIGELADRLGAALLR
jgi:hypothetical protein